MKYDYYYYENLYSTTECKELINVLNLLDNNGIDGSAPCVKKTSSVKIVNYEDLKPYLKKLKNSVLEINKIAFGFDLFEISDYHKINFNSYDSEYLGEYDWHPDIVRDQCYDIKLTAILNISLTTYSGGEFLLFQNGPTIIPQINNTGSLIVFPGWVTHKVNPVTSGSRKTIACFFTGPLFR
jgi:PKHD-type hydroxylase